MALVLGDNFSYQGAKPLDGRIKYDTVANMKAVADATMYDGCLAYCAETDKTYQWKSTNTVDETLGRWREFSTGGSGTSDYSDLINKPSIENVTLSGNKSASDLGLAKASDIPTDLSDLNDDSTHRLVTDTEKTTWNGKSAVSVTQVQSSGTKIATVNVNGTDTDLYAPSGGSGGGHTIEDSEGTDLTQRDTLQFGEGFLAEDDSTNEKTVIIPDVMQSGDMDDVLTPLPSVQSNLPVLYDDSGTERWIGYAVVSGVKHKLYEKTISVDSLPNKTTKSVPHNISNLDRSFMLYGVTYSSTSGSGIVTIPDANYPADGSIRLLIDSTNIQITCPNIDRSGLGAYIIIRYTKTTD